MKLTKAQRMKLISPELRSVVEALQDDELLAVHDLMHEIMERRYGSAKRSEAGRAALSEAEEGRE